MRIPFTLRIEDRLLMEIKKRALLEKYSSSADLIEELILKGMAFDLLIKADLYKDEKVLQQLIKQEQSFRRIYIEE